MDIVGYTDRYSVRAGNTIRFMVSCKLPSYNADVVRLIHGDLNPEGPGFKEKLVQNVGTFSGQLQELVIGSYVVVPDHPLLRLKKSFALSAWISSTTPSKSSQGLLTKWSDSSGTGYGMVLDGDNGLSLWIGGSDGRVERISTGVPLRAPALHAPSWYFVAASYDSSTGRVLLYQQPKTMWPKDPETAAVVEKEIRAVGNRRQWHATHNGWLLRGRGIRWTDHSWPVQRQNRPTGRLRARPELTRA